MKNFPTYGWIREIFKSLGGLPNIGFGVFVTQPWGIKPCKSCFVFFFQYPIFPWWKCKLSNSTWKVQHNSCSSQFLMQSLILLSFSYNESVPPCFMFDPWAYEHMSIWVTFWVTNLQDCLLSLQSFVSFLFSFFLEIYLKYVFTKLRTVQCGYFLLDFSPEATRDRIFCFLT